jgi:uncharacterized protein YyaL (SSP411 family)
MIGALADAGAVLAARREQTPYLAAARRCADFVLGELRDGEGRLLRTWLDGRTGALAYLEDHGYLLEALLTLYESTFEERWFSSAVEVADALIDRFADPDGGGFFTTAADGEPLIARRKDLDDAPIPAGGSSAAFGLLRLAALTGEDRYRRWAESHLRLLQDIAPRHPQAFGHVLSALHFSLGPVREVALVGEELGPMVEVVHERWRPRLVLAGAGGAGSTHPAVPLLRDRAAPAGEARAYVCEGFSCRAPAASPAELAAQLDGDT